MARFSNPLPDDGPQTGGLIVLLGEDPRDAWRWWRVDGDTIASEHRFIPGDDAPWGDVADQRVVALVPAVRAPVRFAPRGDMPAAQAVAAARLSPARLAQPGDAHVVAAADGDVIASTSVSTGEMDSWLAELAVAGIDADALIPASLVLARPAEGTVRVGEIGGQMLARTVEAAFAGETSMVAALAGEVKPVEAGARELADGLVALWQHPPLDLRQGAYARPRVSFFRLPDWSQLARMVAVLLLLVFLIFGVETLRLHLDSNAREAEALEAARARFPAVTDLASAERQVNAELMRRGVGGSSFDAVVPAVFAAMQPVPSLQLRSLSWQGDGTLAIRAAAPRTEDLNTMLLALQREGWVITVPPETAPDATGATVADVTVRAP